MSIVGCQFTFVHVSGETITTQLYDLQRSALISIFCHSHFFIFFGKIFGLFINGFDIVQISDEEWKTNRLIPCGVKGIVLRQ